MAAGKRGIVVISSLRLPGASKAEKYISLPLPKIPVLSFGSPRSGVGGAGKQHLREISESDSGIVPISQREVVRLEEVRLPS